MVTKPSKVVSEERTFTESNLELPAAEHLPLLFPGLSLVPSHLVHVRENRAPKANSPPQEDLGFLEPTSGALRLWSNLVWW